MKVSIITACYNNETTIDHTIRSVQEQLYPDIEHIFIDGGSKDRTLAIIKELAPNAVCISEKDNGIYDALNKGIKLSTGSLIGILHADDFYADPQCISQVVDQLQSDDFDALYGDLLYVDKKNTNKVIRYWKSGEYKKNAFKWGWMPPHPTFFVKKEIYDNYGVFNTNLQSAADYELMLRFIFKQRIRVTYLPKVLVKMRVGGQSNVTLANRIKANEEDRRAWTMNQLRPFWFTRYLKPLSKLVQYFVK